MDLKIYVYKMCLKFVLKLLWIFYYNGYNIEFFIGFFLYVIILKKLKLKSMIVVDFVVMK